MVECLHESKAFSNFSVTWEKAKCNLGTNWSLLFSWTVWKKPHFSTLEKVGNGFTAAGLVSAIIDASRICSFLFRNLFMLRNFVFRTLWFEVGDKLMIQGILSVSWNETQIQPWLTLLNLGLLQAQRKQNCVVVVLIFFKKSKDRWVQKFLCHTKALFLHLWSSEPKRKELQEDELERVDLFALILSYIEWGNFGSDLGLTK